jgi:hypothetical protein
MANGVLRFFFNRKMAHRSLEIFLVEIDGARSLEIFLVEIDGHGVLRSENFRVKNGKPES